MTTKEAVGSSRQADTNPSLQLINDLKGIMSTAPKGFEFEQPMLDIEARLNELEAMTQPSEAEQEEARQLRPTLGRNHPRNLLKALSMGGRPSLSAQGSPLHKGLSESGL